MPLSAVEQRICDLAKARGERLVVDLSKHVGFPTGGRNVGALDDERDLLTERARALGARVEIVPGEPSPSWLCHEAPAGSEPLPTAVCRRPGAGPETLIVGHLDTVHDPLGPFRELTIAPGGATATGPGCVDMKGGLVIALAALEILEEVGERPAWTLLLNSDEETGSFHSAKTIALEAARVAGAGGQGIALEPAMANGGLVTQRAGSAQFALTVTGKAAHVGRDFASGVSAVNALAETIVRAAALVDLPNGTVVNVGPIEGGRTTNVVPDRARAWGNVRFATPEAGAEICRRLEALAGLSSNKAKVEVCTVVGRPAKPVTPGTQRLADLARNVAESLGQQLPFGSTGGVCDGNNMQAAGLATIDTLGVRGGGLHTPEEWIELASLVERTQLLAITILRLSKGERRPG